MANMRTFAAELDTATNGNGGGNDGGNDVCPYWAELSGHGTRSRDPLLSSCFPGAKEAAQAFANGPLQRNTKKPFFVFGKEE